jgi:hypothetical protein
MAGASLGAIAPIRQCACGNPARPAGKRGPIPTTCQACFDAGRLAREKCRRKPSKKLAGTCLECGAGFETHIRCRRFCSTRCQLRAQGKAGIQRVYRCQGCGSEFRPKRTDRTKYCSRSCAYKHQNAWGYVPPTKPKVDRPAKPLPVCRCGTQIPRGRKLCDLCRAKPSGGPVTKACADCGCTITGSRSKRRCMPCGKRRTRKLLASKHGKVKKHRHRARKYGVPYEPINPIAVFERDGWACKCCGRETPKQLRGTLAANAPELDHVIPMSMGGGHLWDNVQCLCRACNGAKGASLPVAA